MHIHDVDLIDAVRAVVAAGGVVVLPTDTVYGVMCDPFNAAAIDKLYALKGRDPGKAIQVLLADADDVPRVADGWTAVAARLAHAFWPGALTLTLPKRADVLPPNLSPHPTVGLRVPNHDAVRAIIRACGGALAATSANLSGAPSPTTLAEARALGDRVDLYVDGGATPGALASTVVETTLAGDGFRVLREGPITTAMLEAALLA